MKKFLSLLLVFCLCCSFAVVTTAQSTQNRPQIVIDTPLPVIGSDLAGYGVPQFCIKLYFYGFPSLQGTVAVSYNAQALTYANKLMPHGFDPVLSAVSPLAPGSKKINGYETDGTQPGLLRCLFPDAVEITDGNAIRIPFDVISEQSMDITVAYYDAEGNKQDADIKYTGLYQNGIKAEEAPIFQNAPETFGVPFFVRYYCLKNSMTVADMKNTLGYEDLRLTDINGNEYNDDRKAVTGDLLYSYKDGIAVCAFEVVLFGDMDFDTVITAADAREVLRVAVGLKSRNMKEMAALGGVENVTAGMAREVLRLAIGLEP